MEKIKNIKQHGKITAVIPVRSGSTRCKNKNYRDFGDTNLLKLKIETLKKVKTIDKILVSSNCDIMLGVAKKLGVNIHKRDEKFCTSICSGTDLYLALANAIDTDILLMTFCVTPFVSVETFEKCINNYKKKNCDSISTSYNFKHYLWYNNKPVNYDYDNSPPTQNLPDYVVPSYGIHITDRYSILKNKNIIGKNPIFENICQTESIDIDVPYEYIVSELLYNNNIHSEETCNLILQNRTPYKDIELLDCTISDGGKVNNWNFSDEFVLNCYKSVSEAGYNYFEIGVRSSEKILTNKGKWCYCLDDDINNIVEKYDGCKIAVLAKLGNFYLSDFKPKKKTNIDLIRLSICKSNIQNNNIVTKSKETCVKLIKLGYDVCLNIENAHSITEKEIEIIIKNYNVIPLKYIYIIDTCGGLNNKKIPNLFHKIQYIKKKYNCYIPIGIQLYNNPNLGLSNTKLCIFHGCKIINSCINGLGLGCGNLKSEDIILELNTNYSRNLNFIPILEFSNEFFHTIEEITDKNIFSNYSFYYLLASYLSVHPEFINKILKEYSNFSVKHIIKLINNLLD